jgi:hypothetical protein
MVFLIHKLVTLVTTNITHVHDRDQHDFKSLQFRLAAWQSVKNDVENKAEI